MGALQLDGIVSGPVKLVIHSTGNIKSMMALSKVLQCTASHTFVLNVLM